jgi:hypothetical protein
LAKCYSKMESKTRAGIFRWVNNHQESKFSLNVNGVANCGHNRKSHRRDTGLMFNNEIIIIIIMWQVSKRLTTTLEAQINI